MLRVRNLGVFTLKLLPIEVRRKEDIGSSKHRLAAKGPNAGLIEYAIDAFVSRSRMFARNGSHHTPPSDRIGIIDLRDGPVEALAILCG